MANNDPFLRKANPLTGNPSTKTHSTNTKSLLSRIKRLERLIFRTNIDTGDTLKSSGTATETTPLLGAWRPKVDTNGDLLIQQYLTTGWTTIQTIPSGL